MSIYQLKKRNTAAKIGLLIFSAVLFISIIMLGYVQTANTAAPLGNIYYEFESTTLLQAKSKLTAVNNDIADEGIVLLKNEDNVLPLSETAKITLFGNGQNKTVAGAGSFTSALSGAGLILNPTVKAFYDSAAGRTWRPSNGNFISGLPTYEVPVSTFTFGASDYNGYKDAAVVVFSRIAGEGTDLPTRMAKGGTNWGGYDGWGSSTAVDGARSVDDHYLQLDQSETDLLAHVCDNFDNVIVLLNTGNMMEMGFLDDPGHYAYHPQIKAALQVGFPEQGTNAVGRILTGKINPSGHLVDTAARDHTKDPTFQNFSRNRAENGNRYYTGTGTDSNYYFVHYEEGIYYGYYYYETRGFTEDTSAYVTDGGSAPHILGTTTNHWSNWYDAHVVYPLGHGLSYTNFDWELFNQSPAEGSQLTKDGKISATVRVTNSGTRAGKEVVQLYYNAPYYADGIEKAHVVLGNFEKTGMIAPGEYEDIKISIDVSEMKSYDYSDANENEFTGYELEEGNYKIMLGRNAHASEIALNYTVPEDGYIYDVDPVTGNPVQNMFDDMSFNETYGVKQYLSRNDWYGTFPTSGTKYRAVTSAFINSLGISVNADYDKDKPWTADGPTTFAADSSNSEIKLNHLIGRDYDDPLWDSFVNQLTKTEIITVVSSGFYETASLERINKPMTRDVDGPWGWGGTNSGDHGVRSICGIMIAQTYNRDLAFDRGSAMAEVGYLGGAPITGWYAPGMNIHRSPFGGRNSEYYSEDARISGIIASAEIMGAKSKGMYSYAKHMFLNDQETNRDSDGLLTWANEQSMREIYAKPFEITVKQGDVQAIMSSFNRLGTTVACHSWETCTGLLRNEWGFEGMVVTDWGVGYMNVDACIRAGNDIKLKVESPSNSAGDVNTHNAALKRAAKNVLFTVANSNAMNGVGESWGNEVNDIPLIYNGESINFTKNKSASASVATATARGNVDSISYLKVAGTMPDGLTLNPDGTITGTPSGASGLYSVTIEAQDKTTSYFHTFSPARAEFSFILADEGEILGVEYTGGQLTDALCGTSYSASVATAKVQGSSSEVFEYTLADDATLPEGLFLSKNGTVSGTPTVPVMDYKFKVKAAILNNDLWEPTEAEFTINTIGRMYLNKREINVYIGKTFSRTLDLFMADGGNASVTFSVKDGSAMPKWLTLNSSTGEISGIPSAFGPYTFTISAKANGFTTAEAVITVNVHEPSYVS